MRIIQICITGCLLHLALPAASADDWPLAFAKLPAHAARGGATSAAPESDCQPDSFDPQSTKYHVAGNKDANPITYRLDGGDDSVSMTIDSRDRQDDVKTALPEPYSVTRYIFKCASGSSEFLEFRKNGRRYAIHAHVSQARFTPDGQKLILYNYAKPHHGSWQSLRRVFDIRTRRYVDLPVVDETDFLADAGNDGFVTYGPPASRQDPRRRMVVIWGLDGKVLQALTAPLQPGSANQSGSNDAVGLLPDEPGTFYHLTRTGENECTLRLQDIRNSDGRRAIRLAVPGAATDPTGIGTRVQIDLAGLKLGGGTMKYRVSPSGAGNSTGDWGAWQVGQ